MTTSAATLAPDRPFRGPSRCDAWAHRLLSSGSKGGTRWITAHVAEAVLREARDSNVGLPFPDHEIPSAVAEAMWEPRYSVLTPAEPKSALPEVIER